MFNEISTLSDKSNFDNYNSTKIRNMSDMFYNCKSLKNLTNTVEVGLSSIPPEKTNSGNNPMPFRILYK